MVFTKKQKTNMVSTPKKETMVVDSFTEDHWISILARLPLKSISRFKLVCKQWKSVLESPFLHHLFMSHHQNSHSSWSLMCRGSPKEAFAQYGCDIWGLERSLGSYVSSFITAKFYTKKRKARLCPLTVSVLDYTEVGLILIYKTFFPKRALYVANPVSRQCIRIPPIPILLLRARDDDVYKFYSFREARLVTNGVSGYKVVLLEQNDKGSKSFLNFIIYSSDTGLWRSKTIYSPVPWILKDHREPISCNGYIHWLGLSLDNQDVVVSLDFYGSDDHQFRVTPFPDLDNQTPELERCCSTCQGNLMYMKLDSGNKVDGGSVEHKLSAWRLKNWEWQLVCEISPDFGSDYIPKAINPFDGVTMYLWSNMYKSLASINLRNGNSTVHNVLESSRDALISGSDFSTFVLPLPRWLYRIPQPPCLQVTPRSPIAQVNQRPVRKRRPNQRYQN